MIAIGVIAGTLQKFQLKILVRIKVNEISREIGDTKNSTQSKKCIFVKKNCSNQQKHFNRIIISV